MTDSYQQTFKIPIVKILALSTHPNAQFLSIASGSGWSCVVRTEEFLDQNLAVFVPVDSVAEEDHPLLGFLGGKPLGSRVFRGVSSDGLLLSLADVGNYCFSELKMQSNTFVSLIKEGQDFSSILKIERFNRTDRKKNDSVFLPNVKEFPKYGETCHLRSRRHNFYWFDNVCVTEKLHGASARYGLVNGKYFIGTRNCVLNPESGSSHWHRAEIEGKIKNRLQRLQKILPKVSRIIFYGEVVGKGVQDLDYGFSEPAFFLYDLVINSTSLSPPRARKLAERLGLRVVPVLSESMSFNIREIALLVDGPSVIVGACHMREGIVIKPVLQFRNVSTSEVVSKVISSDFLRRKGGIDNYQD
jgi:RNA ligase (TIGR02306 family)